MLECSALVFNQLHSVVEVLFFSTELLKFLRFGVQRIVMCYIVQSLCAGYPEVIFYAPVLLLLGITSRNRPHSQVMPY